MRELKTHLKLKGKPLCGTKRQTRKLKFAENEASVTCENCKRAVRS
jgi:hypothetical protein